uniref:Uncharacterized protein n=1 Tax=Chromera velia CCMP2878 TaxID=1169474 RepID=A0A0G4FR78_9ALVE|eukprot:Cvel_18345.t1-p1 / transcript=Cvel_18345.t1 / gene=Cvel_18345 / organism=Chromera_velia_CCMP2878 / gene_product=hypothetical protein / transcript_product=hypothetical protein / location=Cvel_scaffold1515:38275-41298(+) / protein_length=765 / sequence_SO=supercontig / SO=protein_coding / is_pseudo=false
MVQSSESKENYFAGMDSAQANEQAQKVLKGCLHYKEMRVGKEVLTQLTQAHVQIELETYVLAMELALLVENVEEASKVVVKMEADGVEAPGHVMERLMYLIFSKQHCKNTDTTNDEAAKFAADDDKMSQKKFEKEKEKPSTTQINPKQGTAESFGKKFYTRSPGQRCPTPKTIMSRNNNMNSLMPVPSFTAAQPLQQQTPVSVLFQNINDNRGRLNLHIPTAAAEEEEGTLPSRLSSNSKQTPAPLPLQAKRANMLDSSTKLAGVSPALVFCEGVGGLAGTPYTITHAEALQQSPNALQQQQQLNVYAPDFVPPCSAQTPLLQGGADANVNAATRPLINPFLPQQQQQQHKRRDADGKGEKEGPEDARRKAKEEMMEAVRKSLLMDLQQQQQQRGDQQSPPAVTEEKETLSKESEEETRAKTLEENEKSKIEGAGNGLTARLSPSGGSLSPPPGLEHLAPRRRVLNKPFHPVTQTKDKNAQTAQQQPPPASAQTQLSASAQPFAPTNANSNTCKDGSLHQVDTETKKQEARDAMLSAVRASLKAPRVPETPPSTKTQHSDKPAFSFEALAALNSNVPEDHSTRVAPCTTKAARGFGNNPRPTPTHFQPRTPSINTGGSLHAPPGFPQPFPAKTDKEKDPQQPNKDQKEKEKEAEGNETLVPAPRVRSLTIRRENVAKKQPAAWKPKEKTIKETPQAAEQEPEQKHDGQEKPVCVLRAAHLPGFGNLVTRDTETSDVSILPSSAEADKERGEQEDDEEDEMVPILA